MVEVFLQKVWIEMDRVVWTGSVSNGVSLWEDQSQGWKAPRKHPVKHSTIDCSGSTRPDEHSSRMAKWRTNQTADQNTSCKMRIDCTEPTASRW